MNKEKNMTLNKTDDKDIFNLIESCYEETRLNDEKLLKKIK